jgi:hypothetical protein
MFGSERVPINIAPEVRERLNNLLYSDAFMGTGVGFSAFIDRACEAAETEHANELSASPDVAVTKDKLRDGDRRQWCPVCKLYHRHVGEKTDAGHVTQPCPLLAASDSRNYS